MWQPFIMAMLLPIFKALWLDLLLDTESAIAFTYLEDTVAFGFNGT